ncbi:MAG: 2-amino-4-hydroxy-6-hydroxymethyldihydropteridine diphosphokinase [Cypionkella sp.]
MTRRNFPVLIALGGNLPWDGKQSVDVLRAALDQLCNTGLGTVRASRLFATPCFPAGAGPDYVNAAASLQTDLPAAEVLAALHRVEAGFGRTRSGRWGGRTLDLDLIAAGDTVAPDPATWAHWHDLDASRQTTETPGTLILPHPRLQDRAFVLVPLMDIAPDWRHPVLGKTVAEMTAALPQSDIDEVRPL